MWKIIKNWTKILKHDDRILCRRHSAFRNNTITRRQKPECLVNVFEFAQWLWFFFCVNRNRLVPIYYFIVARRRIKKQMRWFLKNMHVQICMWRWISKKKRRKRRVYLDVELILFNFNGGLLNDVTMMKSEMQSCFTLRENSYLS